MNEQFVATVIYHIKTAEGQLVRQEARFTSRDMALNFARRLKVDFSNITEVSAWSGATQLV